jgi:AcrR family transcriptional regulator
LSSVNRSRNSRLELRGALIAAAARLIATEGTSALTLRRVADEVGTSTMAIYTHFGGMPELRRAVRREGFARLAARGARVGQSEDPVADVAMLGVEYYLLAMSEPHLYRVMYMEQPLDEADAASGQYTFGTLADAMKRCIGAGRFAAGDPETLAREFWALGHGLITLQLARLLSAEEVRVCMADGALRLFTAFGDDPRAANASVARVGRHARVRAEQQGA